MAADGTAGTNQDELQRLAVYAAFLALFGAVFSLVAFVHQPSGASLSLTW